MPGKDLPKAYDASTVEDAIYAEWEASGMFNPDNLPDRNQSGEPYCIMMPPPNRTGTLHMGHASMLAIEDLLIRFHRMQGKKTLWVPGTDHAAISTQVKVEQLLIKEGMKDPRKELGREAFLQKVVAFAEGSANTIRNQVRKMGSSCDWSRERYTFDDDRNVAVNALFKMMHEDGIIERGYRVVNWDPQFQTTLSDDEVLTKETTAKLLTFTYDADFPIAISTTRPETKFGDTAVAVHPDDARYKEFIGKTFTPMFCGKQISVTVIADVAVDPTFGTGALGVTPAHSMVDADMAVRHELPTVVVIGADGKMTAEAGPSYAGLTVKEAREKVEHQLEQQGLLQKMEEIPQNLPVAERGGGVVEQLPMRQWFIRVNRPFALRQDTLGKWKQGDDVTLKELMTYAVESGQTSIMPDRFRKTYFHWINNLRDWCISRQIWFGHQIPVWYKGDDTRVSPTSPGDGWERDPDTLDTWFSSGAWTFSALGWPNKEEWQKYRAYHPTAVLETGYDILFFWVARMILMSAYAIGEVPFKDVYLHGLVRDEQGRKMSKSLGNVLDPLDLIPKYGTDAVRLSLLMGSTPGQDVKLSEAKVEGFRNFTNKLWNISRFILLSTEGTGGEGQKTLADRWIIDRLNTATASVTKKLERYEFSSAGEELRDFTWNDFADWYLEIAKVEGGKDAVLRQVLKTLLPLWHPFMPFVTEHIWKEMGSDTPLIITPWPAANGLGEGDTQDAMRFEILRSLVTDARRLRAENGVEPAKQVEITLTASGTVKKLVEENQRVISHLIRASAISIADAAPEGWATTVSGTTTVALNLTGAVDVEKERAKSAKELTEARAYAESLRAKLANEEFTSKAPAHVVAGMKEKLEEAEGKIEALEK
ncbi:MAG: valyl-tRNA synthetase, valyl-tRNA synthetase [Candidatus Parcubacteria bacterium]|jgi:valyl-tRNA synthetase